MSADFSNLEQMIRSKLDRQLEIWSAKSWGDEDIVSDLDSLTGKLQEAMAKMSTFELYCEEVRSGELAWSPVRLSAAFCVPPNWVEMVP